MPGSGAPMSAVRDWVAVALLAAAVLIAAQALVILVGWALS
jgi:hypothetical protein